MNIEKPPAVFTVRRLVFSCNTMRRFGGILLFQLRVLPVAKLKTRIARMAIGATYRIRTR